MQRFPHRTLEELDTIDWPRLQRADEIERIREAELRRRLYLEDKIQNDEVTDDEWEMWAHHQRILGEDGI